MQRMKEKGSRKLWIMVVILSLAAALLFWLEWMGSEQQLGQIEQNLPQPATLKDNG